MKKILLLLLSIILLNGCTTMINTPTKTIEEFFNKYQSLDEVVLNQLEEILKEKYTLTKKQIEEYKEIIKKQYRKLKYMIKEEIIENDNATVKTEIEVYDYSKSLKEANEYLTKNQNEFINEDGTTNIEKYHDYKIKKLNQEQTRIKYIINFNLKKEDEKWNITNLTEIEKQKILGIYTN